MKPVATLALMAMTIPAAHAEVPSGRGLLAGFGKTQFAMIGDMPYRDTDILKLDELIREINDASIDFTVHTGDIKSGSSTCADELLRMRLDQLQQFKNPLVYTPGDNEWTDCHRVAAGGYNPLERLQALRALFFPKAKIGHRKSFAELQHHVLIVGFGRIPYWDLL